MLDTFASARAYLMVSFVKKSQMNQILFRERGDKFFNKKITREILYFKLKLTSLSVIQVR